MTTEPEGPDEVLESYKAEIERLNAEAERHKAEAERLRRELAVQTELARRHEQELARIQAGAAWSFLVKYRRWHARLAPPGSVRYGLYRTVMGIASPHSQSTRPKPRLGQRVRFLVQRVQTLARVARMVVRTQGAMQLLRFAARKFAWWRRKPEVAAAGPPTAPPLRRRVCVVIPTYNQTTLVADCVDSIWRSLLPESRPLVRIVVVDDGSRPSVQASLRLLPAQLLLNPENKGFARGVNDGLATLEPAEDAIILNNDTLAHDGWIEALQSCAHADPRVGIVGPKLLYPDGRIQSAGSYRSVGAPEWFDHCYRFTPADHPPANIQREVLAVTGACMYVKREVLEAIGSLDPDFPMAYEDVDYCLRARQAGFQVLYCPLASLTHLEGHTRGERKEARELVSQERFWRKWGGHFEGRRVWKDSPDRLSIIYVMQDTGVGGGARVAFEQLNRLAERGHDVELYSLAERPKWFPLVPPVRTFASYPALLAALAGCEAIKVATWWETAEQVWRGSLVNGIPVYLVQDIETSYYGTEHPEEQARVVASYRKEFHYITDAGWTRDQLQALGAAARVVAPGIDHRVYRRLDLPRERGVVLSVGRSNPLKNFDLLLRAYPRLEERAALWLFGIEPQLARGLASQYTFAPTDAGVAELYNRANVFVLTSRHEGFGLPILEAMACACPVICTDADGNMDFCRDGENCLIVPKDDEETLAATLDRLLRDGDLQDRLRKGGLETVSEYTWEKAIVKLEDFYRGIARDRSRRLAAPEAAVVAHD